VLSFKRGTGSETEVDLYGRKVLVTGLRAILTDADSGQFGNTRVSSCVDFLGACEPLIPSASWFIPMIDHRWTPKQWTRESDLVTERADQGTIM
jgi:hypothetical protein